MEVEEEALMEWREEVMEVEEEERWRWRRRR